MGQRPSDWANPARGPPVAALGNKRLRCGRKAKGASEAVMLLSLDPLATGQPVPGHLLTWILDSGEQP